jgi:hypothetical protein
VQQGMNPRAMIERLLAGMEPTYFESKTPTRAR